MPSSRKGGALAGLRVLDFGQYVAGPLTAQLLGDQGAEVVRIEPPGGPRWRHPANATYQRGKRWLVLDLKRPGDLEIARRLVATADVLVENFRPGVMDRLGLGAAGLCAANPRLIYCSLPGFAAKDPRHGIAAWEGVVATSARVYMPPWYRDDPAPVFSALPLASSYAAFLAAATIVAALFARERDGHGRRIEVPLFDASLQMLGAYAMSGDGAGQPAYSSDIWGAGRYRCADGRWVQFATHNPRFVEALVAVGGVPEWRAAGLLDRARLAAEPALLAELRRRVTVLFQTRPALAWEESLSAAGAPLTLVRSAEEWMTSEHASASQAVVELDDPRFGRMRQAGFPVTLSLTPPSARPREAAPTDPAGLAASRPAPAAPAGAPLAALLQDVTVLDLTQVLAGPSAGRLLAEFGADVVKINDPRQPPQGYRYHLDVNRGKRTLLLDLQQPAGLALFRRLAATADVVLQNFALGVAERLGLDYEALARDRPDLIYGSVSAYGYRGPWGGRRGYEPLGQAMTGMQARFGGDGPPEMEPHAVTDYGTGLLAGFAMLLALYHRQRTGEGQQVEASLAQTGSYLQAPYLQLHAGKRWDEPRGQRARGSGPLQRLYRAADGWCFLGARDVAQLAGVQGLESLAGVAAGDLETALETALATATVATWQERLLPRDVGLAALPSIEALMADPYVRSQGLAITRVHEGVGQVTQVGPSARVTPSPPVPGDPVRPAGADGAAILAELGYDAAEIAALRASGVVAGF